LDAFFSGLLQDSTAEAWQTGHSIIAEVFFMLVSMAFGFGLVISTERFAPSSVNGKFRINLNNNKSNWQN